MSIDLAQKLHALARPRVLVVGDLIVDHDLHGRIERTAQEAPGCPVFLSESSTERPGGAGAVAAMARGLGAEVRLVCGAASDRIRHYVEGRQVYRHDRNARPLSDAEARRLAGEVAEGAAWADAVLIADYGRGVCTADVLRDAIGVARRRLVPRIVDPARGVEASQYADASWIKCNEREFAALKARGGPLPPRVIVTLGAAGIRPMRTDSERYATTHPARPRLVADVTGAGDMVLAALGACLAGGCLDVHEACQIANAAAGLKVERHGAVAVSRAEVVLDLLAGDKRLPLELVGALADVGRIRERRVVLTNGCFDVLHAGHVQYLAEARAQGDVLVVAVNDDASVHRLKGAGRPQQCLADRAAVLAGLACVDHVVPFRGEAELAELAHVLAPAVLVKGADYRHRKITGAEYAGRVHLAALRPGCSTTGVLAGAREVQTSAPGPDSA